MVISLDGNKATGKTTLLVAARKHFGESVAIVSEKRLDPYRAETLRQIESFRPHPTPAQDLVLLDRFARGRAEVSKRVLEINCNLVLLDRWYLSDAAFRPSVTLDQVRAVNRSQGVLEPHRACVTFCPPEISWERAHSRPKGLCSLVVRSPQQMRAVHQRYLRVATEAGAHLLDTSGEEAETVEHWLIWLEQQLSQAGASSPRRPRS